MRRLRLFPLLTALLLVLTTLPAAAAESDWLLPKVRETPAFSDVQGTWCQDYVKTVCEAGLMEGKSADRFDPAGTLTEAQRLVIGVRLHALFHGRTLEAAAPGEAWWLPAARYYLEADQGDTLGDTAAAEWAALADTPATRLSFAWQMVWSTPSEHLTPINNITEIPDFSDSAYQSAGFGETPVLSLYQAGVLNGTDSWGKFDPRGTLTRGQAAAMLARIIDPGLRLKFDLPDFDLCRDVLQLAPETVLLTVGGTGITAEQLSDQLAQALKAWPPEDTDTALKTVEAWASERIALERLAALRGISVPSGEQLTADIRLSARRPGVSDGALKWEVQHNELEAALAFYYDPSLTAYLPGFSPRPAAMERDLTTISATLSVVPSSALNALDLAAVRQRLVASPYSYTSTGI